MVTTARVWALLFLITVVAWAPSARSQTASASASAEPPASTSPPPARPPKPEKPAPKAEPAPAPAPAPKPDLDVVPDPDAPSTPRRAFAAFLRAAERSDFASASELLDLRALPRNRDPREANELASMLYRVLALRISLDAEALPDEASPKSAGPEGIILDVVEVDGKTINLALVPVKQPSGELRWQFSRATVGSIRAIYDANQRLAVEERVPSWLKRKRHFGLFAWQWLGFLVLGVLAYAIGRSVGSLTFALLRRLAKPFSRTASDAAASLERPARLALAVTAFNGLEPYLLLPHSLARGVASATTTLYITATAWAFVAVVHVLTSSWERRLPEDTVGDLESRGLRTRLTMLRRIASVIVGLVAAGVALLQFEVVRSVGVSLLASAGIAGVLVGIAAQRTLGGIIAGIEMSITQPLRIGDVVVFRAQEFGTVEEIFFTYIIVRLWDDRRLIVPVTRVMSEPFENWTRTDARVLSPVEIFVDYAAPIERFRARFRELCEANDKWDRRVCRVEVIEATDKALKIRGLASVDVATKAVDLRNELREGWIAFLQSHENGVYMPTGRVESMDRHKPLPSDSVPRAGDPSEGLTQAGERPAPESIKTAQP